VRHLARPDREVGGLVERLAFADQALDGRGRIRGLQQRPVRAAPDPAHDGVDIGLEPDRDGLAANAVAGFLAQESAAAGREYIWAAVEQPRDHPRFAVPEMRLAMGFENIRDRHARGRLDLGIGVEKRQPQPRRQPPPDGRLARPHHAHQHDRTRSQRRKDFGLRGRTSRGL